MVIYLAKTDDPSIQKALDNAKNNDSENVYRRGVIYDQIKADFQRKCYLCEDDEIIINIEHFEPHKNDLNKKYDWRNLFYSCAHCNSIKGVFWPLLNCTDVADQVWQSIEIRFIAFPKSKVEVILSPDCPKSEAGENTRKLLENILIGEHVSAMKQDQAATLRKKMHRAYTHFVSAINKKDDQAIKHAIADDAAFAGMLRWTLKNDYPRLFAELMAI